MNSNFKPVTDSEMMLEFITSYGYRALETYRELLLAVSRAATNQEAYAKAIKAVKEMEVEFELAAKAMFAQRDKNEAAE